MLTRFLGNQLLKRIPPLPTRFQSCKCSTSAAREYASPQTQQPIRDPYIVAPPTAEIMFPRDVTLVEYIRSVIRPWANQTAFECAASGIQLTHNQVFKSSRKFAAALYQTGLRRGDVVGILHSNSPLFAIAFYGLLEAGLIANLLSPLLPAERLATMMAQTRTKAVITSPDLAPEMVKIKQCPQGHLLRLVISTGDGPLPDGCHSFNEMLKTDDSATVFPRGSDVNFDEDGALIFWSGGTTGPPKPVMHTHKSVLSQSFQALDASVNIYDYGTDTAFCIAPMYHGYGNVCILRMASLVGAKVVTMPKFDPTAFQKCLHDYKPAMVTMNSQLLDYCGMNETVKSDDLKHTRTVTSGGACISPAVRDRFFEKFGQQIFLQNLYGTSEVGLTHGMPLSHVNQKPGSIGQLMPNTYAKIVDSHGATMEAGREGEMLIMGPQIMKGYMNQSEATSATIDSNGWVHTGDICYYDEDGFFYITDRIKDLIKVKGLQVSPSLIESYLNTHPKIKESAVVGVPDQRAGQLPKAFVVPKDGSLTVEELNQFLETKLAKHEQLKGGIVMLDAIPKDPIGKIRRNELKNL